MQREKVIPFDDGMPDNEVKEVMWRRYGLIETNEIVVTATFRDRVFAIARESSLSWPGMIDRLFGIDVDDARLAGELADELWPLVKQTVIT